MMQYRRLGRSHLRVSRVGFGTCQLRLVTEQEAIDTLKRGFDLGVNIVHTAPDYEGAFKLVAQSIEESGHDVIVASQGYGDMAHFEWLFETTCRTLKKQSLEIFGIACIDDREYLGENVWDPGGMVEFLLKKKQDGRLAAVFCTTHGTPGYIKKLITSGVFDAVMVSYNPLGFHLLSYYPEPPRTPENISRHKQEIFPLAARHDVGLMIMKPLAGGLLCDSKAFPPHADFCPRPKKLGARDILRSMLLNDEICCVFPGTASVEEAEENALSGHEPMGVSSDTLRIIENVVDDRKTSLCSRCGRCDALCSKGLPVSWLFRDAYISNYPSETFETIDRLQYFHLHPENIPSCSTCTQVTCLCPNGIDIPKSLINIHKQMIALKEKSLLPTPANELQKNIGREATGVKLVRRDIPTSLHSGQKATCRLYLHNAGEKTWISSRALGKNKGMVLAVFISGNLLQHVRLRHDVEPEARTHFVFELRAPKRIGHYQLGFFLMQYSKAGSRTESTEILTLPLFVKPIAPRDQDAEKVIEAA